MDSAPPRAPTERRLAQRLLLLNLALAVILGAGAAALFNAMAPQPAPADDAAAMHALTQDLARALAPAQTLANSLAAVARTHWTSAVDLKITAGAVIEAAASPDAIVAIGLWPATDHFSSPGSQQPLLWTRADDAVFRFSDAPQRFAPNAQLWFSAALLYNGPGCLWSSRHPDPATHRAVLTCSTPVMSSASGNVLGLVAVNIDPTALQGLLDERPAGYYGFILDRNNDVIATPSGWPDTLLASNLAGVAQFKPELGPLAVAVHNRHELEATLAPESSAATLAASLQTLADSSDAQAAQRIAAHLTGTLPPEAPTTAALSHDSTFNGPGRVVATLIPQLDMRVVLGVAGDTRIYGLHRREWAALGVTAGVLLVGMLLSFALTQIGVLTPLRELIVRLSTQPDDPLHVSGRNEFATLQALINEQQQRARDLRSQLLTARAGVAAGAQPANGPANGDAAPEVGPILNSFEEAIIVTDDGGHIDFMNAAAESLSGWPLAQAARRHFDEVFIIHDQSGQKHIKDLPGACLRHTERPRHALAAMFRTRSGHNLPVSVRTSPMRSRMAATGVVITLHDRRAEPGGDVHDRHALPRDPLTQCLTRPVFDADLAVRVESVRMGAAEPFSVAFIDVDALQSINESVGSEAGDELLRQLAHLIATDLGTDSTVYRLHGDKFAAIIEGADDAQARVAVELLRADVQSWGFKWKDAQFESTITAALVSVDAATARPVDVIRSGFDACHRAKLEGRNRVVTATVETAPVPARSSAKDWLSEIKRGLAEDRFHLSTFRAQALQRGSSDGDVFESILQLEDEEGFWAQAHEFMPSAEAAELGMQLDQWVVQRIFERIGADASLQQTVAVCIIPLSDNSLQSPAFLDMLMDALKTYGVPPEKICFQASQHSIQDHLAAARTLFSALQRLGCRLCVSEISTNPTGFSLLKELPADYVKIDPALTSRAIGDAVERLVVESVHKIAHTLGKRTIAEHVDKPETLRLLQGIGIDIAIGNAVARPNPMLFGATI